MAIKPEVRNSKIMKTKRSLYITLSFLVFILSFYACKKDEPIEKKLIGTWELNKITFLETKVSYPLDSFRNLRNVSLTLNSDFSFKSTEIIDAFSFGPLLSSEITESYAPRNSKARFLLYKYSQDNSIADLNFSIDRDTLIFKEKKGTANYSYERNYKRKFNLVTKNELEVDREDILIVNIHNRSYPSEKLRFSFKRK